MANIFYRDFTPTASFLNPNKPSYKECLAYFVKFLQHFSFFSRDDLENLNEYWDYCIIKKNAPIVLPGEVCDQIVFICRGAVKHFTGTTDNQYIIEFATDCNFCAGLRSFVNQSNAQDGYICTKNTYGLSISYKKFQQLIKKRPVFGQMFNLLSEQAVSNIITRLSSFQSTDAKGRYELMLSQHPDVFNNFSMQDISNYLGIKAETLSRLKKGLEKQ